MWDILKRRKKWEKEQAQSRAFVKILRSRMPNLDQILDDWGYYDLDSWWESRIQELPLNYT